MLLNVNLLGVWVMFLIVELSGICFLEVSGFLGFTFLRSVEFKVFPKICLKFCLQKKFSLKNLKFIVVVVL